MERRLIFTVTSPELKVCCFIQTCENGSSKPDLTIVKTGIMLVSTNANCFLPGPYYIKLNRCAMQIATIVVIAKMFY